MKDDVQTRQTCSLHTQVAWKEQLGRPRCRRKYIKMYLKETGLEGVDWIHLTHDTDRLRALVNTVMNLLVP